MKELQSIKQRFSIIGNADNFNHALGVAVRVAATNLSVLITGESGVGKEVFSKIIHNLSPRKHNTFIAVNCGAIPEGTIDSELFGHEKGAFTGASDHRKGYFETVNGGTIFLDEIGEMPLSTQSRLLRVLESGEYIKVGSSKVNQTDVRIVAATNVNLLDAIAAGKFREDLYYRLNTVPIEVPSLRDRPGDIYLLFRKFAVDFAENHRMETISLDDEAKQVLINYRWPGNIRELKNLSEQISVLSINKSISAQELMEFLPDGRASISRLPILAASLGENTSGVSERDLLYKVLFDMKKDITDLKRFVLKMAEGGTPNPSLSESDIFKDIAEPSFEDFDSQRSTTHKDGPIVINTPDYSTQAKYHPTNPNIETIDESLSIADKERELIEKALKKHRGKRKDAALDLGISERTLYRKIKEYDLIDL